MANLDIKPWGECLHAYEGNVEVDIVDARAGGYSSVHKHETKTNLFIHLSGAVDVLIFRAPPKPAESDPIPSGVKQLRRYGDTAEIPAGVWHQFCVIEDAKLVEVYFATPVHGDIIRANVNGCVPNGWDRGVNGLLPWEK